MMPGLRKILCGLCAVAMVAWAAGPPPTPAAPANVGPIGSIVDPSEPGARMVVSGRVFAPDGITPASGVVVYAYQTDAAGQYRNDPTTRIARLHGWTKTDGRGHFEFHTIRPGAYPGRSIAAHIHFHIYGGGYPLQWTEELLFADDPLVKPEQIRHSAELGQFANVAAAVHDADGTEHYVFNIRASATSNYPPGTPLTPF